MLPHIFSLRLPVKPVALLALAGFCCAVLPIPLGFQQVTGKKSSQPFPCQSRACGCSTPQQCWTSCCCSGPAERLAWAQRNGVKPPAYAVLPGSGPTKPLAQGTKRSCCESKTKACCTATKSRTTTEVPARSCCLDRGKPSTSDSESETTWVLSMMALKCQGASSSFTSLPWTILMALPEDLVATPLEVIPVPRVEVPSDFISSPEAPPPRC